MGVLASSTERPPHVDVEAFPPDKKVLPDLLRTPPHEPEVFALALGTRVLAKTTVLQHLQLVLAVQVIAKAPAKMKSTS